MPLLARLAGLWRATAVTSLVLTLGAVVPVAAATSAQSAPAPAAAPVSMWVWSDGDPAELVTFATEQAVDRMYVYVYRPRGAELTRLEQLADLADDAGIELWAMSGDPHWALQHRAVLSWQRKALATGLFVGTHLDVEPYSLRAWDTRRSKVIKRFVTMLDKVQEADDRPLEVDVPYWYGDFSAPGGGGDTLADAVLDVADAVTVMSYRDTATGPNSLLVVAEDMLARAAAAGVPIELAVETNALGCEHCTFFEEGADAMRAVIADVTAELAGHPTFTGFAVHDFDGFRALTEETTWATGS